MNIVYLCFSKKFSAHDLSSFIFCAFKYLELVKKDEQYETNFLFRKNKIYQLLAENSLHQTTSIIIEWHTLLRCPLDADQNLFLKQIYCLNKTSRLENQLVKVNNRTKSCELGEGDKNTSE